MFKLDLIVDLMNKIPAPISVAKEDIMAGTKLAVSVLQDHNLEAVHESRPPVG